MPASVLNNLEMQMEKSRKSFLPTTLVLESKFPGPEVACRATNLARALLHPENAKRAPLMKSLAYDKVFFTNISVKNTFVHFADRIKCKRRSHSAPSPEEWARITPSARR